MKKKCIGRILSITLVITLFAVCGITGYAANSSSGGIFSTDFSSEADLSVWKQEKGDPSGVAIQEDHFIIEDGTMKPERQGIIVGILYKNDTYENVLIEAEVNKMTRFQFRVASDSTWSDQRFYVEIDFGGAIILRNQDDVELGSTLVYNLVSREMTKVKIRVYGNTVEVYLHGNTEPDFSFSDAALVSRTGYFSMMYVWQDPNVDNIKLTKLDSQGLYNGINPITGEGNKSSAAESSGYNYSSSLVSSSASQSSSSSSSSSSSAAVSAESQDDSSISPESGSQDSIDEISESGSISESQDSQESQLQMSSEAGSMSERSETASSANDDEKKSSAMKWIIPVVIILAAGLIAVAVVFIKKNKKQKES